MKPWWVRAASMVAVHVAVRTALELALLSVPEREALLRPAAAVALVAVALLWAGLDALRHSPAAPPGSTPDTDDLAGRWFLAALVAGPVAGLLGWALQGALVDASGPERLGVELTGGAAFTALLVLVPALVGLAIGRRVGPAAVSPGRPGTAGRARSR